MRKNRQMPVRTGPEGELRPKSRLMAAVMALLLAITAMPWLAMTGCEPAYAAGSSKAEILAVAETITDEAAKAEIVAAAEEGAEVRFTYAADGRVAAYQIIRESVSKKHEDMTEAEKRQALNILIARGTVPNRITVDGDQYSLNITLWMERGIIVYGETAQINSDTSVTSGANYKDGQYRFWGYDVNGGLYGNDDFPRDSDSGTPAYEKDWLTTAEIRESSIARKYIGEHGMASNGRCSDGDKRTTANKWLAENPAWGRAGITADYILEHFYFNSVISSSGLTSGQFTGVHLSRQSGTLYYQSFAVQGEIRTFQVSEGTVEERILIENAELPEEEVVTESAVTLDVSLSLPILTYEGHPVTATDHTGFTVDGEWRSATRVYADGLATNRFKLPAGGGTITKNRSVPTKAEAVFETVGTYPVSLTVTAKGGNSGTDTKYIEVKKTPAIQHSLTGTQKENRAQTLNLWVATNPKRPLTELWVELTDLTTGQTVRLDHNLTDPANNQLNNNETIKTRPIRPLESDQLFTNCKLEFLTKNTTEQAFSYTVYAKDSAGETDRITGTFTVAPDLAPVAQIQMDETFLRREGENVADIIAADESQTDGDQLERVWSFEGLTGYQDLSFGTGQKISFPKTGVGEFQVMLEVKDRWTEPTLEEYVTEADRKSAVTTKNAEVINIAPQVSLEPGELKTAEVLILTDDDQTYKTVKSQLAQVAAALLEEGYDGKVIARQMLPQTVSESQPWEKTLEVNTAFGYQGSWTSLYESNNFIADDRRLYKIDATWPGSDKDYYPEAPYTITAWNGETGDVDWTYTFDDTVMAVPGGGPYFAQDDGGVYLYFISQGKTMVLDKETGAMLTILPFAMEKRCFVAENRIFTVKSDGIYAVHTGTGKVTKVYSGILGGGAARHGNKIHFVTRNGAKLYRAALDPETQIVTLQQLELAASTGVSYALEQIRTDGSLLLKETQGSTISFKLFDRQGKLKTTVSHSGNSVVGMAARSGSGDSDYVVYLHKNKNNSYYYMYFTCYNIHTGARAQTYLRNVNGYPAENRIIAAEQSGDTVYMAAGAYITWIADYGWGTGPTHGYPQRTRTIRFNMAGNSAVSVANSALDMDEMKEYGDSSDVYAVIHSGQNGQYQSPPSGNITALYRRHQTPEQVEQRYRARYLSDDGSADRQEVFVLTGGALAEESLAQLVKQRVSQNKEETTSYVNLQTATAGGTLWRDFVLEPKTTYYYEYDLYTPDSESAAADIFSVEGTVTRRSDHLMGKGYRVTKTIAEPFDNNELHTEYFAGINAGNLSGDQWTVSPYPESKRLKTASATLTFTVEPGQQAVLSFDYVLKLYSTSARFANYVVIDGEVWKMPMNGTVANTGHYTHPFLLEEGEHTVQIFAGTYATSSSSTSIDNLTVEYVEFTEDELPAGTYRLTDPNTSSKTKVGDGWTRVKGSFETPAELIAYEGLPGTITEGTAGDGVTSTLDTSNRRTRYLTYIYPEGETPVYSSIATTSSPRIYKSRHYPVNWTVGGMAAYAYEYSQKDPDDIIGPRGLPGSYEFILPVNGTEKPWGNPVVTVAYSAPSGAGGFAGNMSDISLVTVEQPDESTANKEFFFNSTGSAVGIYGANLWSEAAARVSFGTSGESPGPDEAEGAIDVGIANLKIYTVKNGVRLYLAEEDITGARELSHWTAENVTAEVKTDGAEVEEDQGMVYAKGQLVYTKVHYYDYESDPGKVSYWKYTHLPYNDGPHPQAAAVVDDDGNVVGGTGQILSEPIQRFYVDGKYIAEHWQTDNTGDPDYDKDSNVATMILYIGGSSSAPWIDSITLRPAGAGEGDDISLRVTVDNLEKDPLRLDVEIYKEGTLIHRQRFDELEADSTGTYPAAITDPIRSIEAGKYEVICTVRDELGTGIGNRQFTIKPQGSVEGEVAHTAAWDSNRRSYNLNLFGTNAPLYNAPMTLEQYLSCSEPRPRGSNVFWAGEEFILTAYVGGKPTSVTAEIGGYTTRLTSTGRKTDDGKTIYKGTLWDKAMRSRWGKTPQALDVTFRSYYESGEVKEHVVTVIVDSDVEYWLLHRYF